MRALVHSAVHIPALFDGRCLIHSLNIGLFQKADLALQTPNYINRIVRNILSECMDGVLAKDMDVAAAAEPRFLMDAPDGWHLMRGLH